MRFQGIAKIMALALAFAWMLAAGVPCPAQAPTAALTLIDGLEIEVVDLERESGTIRARLANGTMATFSAERFIDPVDDWQERINAARRNERWPEVMLHARLQMNWEPGDRARQQQYADLQGERNQWLALRSDVLLSEGNVAGMRALFDSLEHYPEPDLRPSLHRYLGRILEGALHSVTTDNVAVRRAQARVFADLWPEREEVRQLLAKIKEVEKDVIAIEMRATERAREAEREAILTRTLTAAHDSAAVGDYTRALEILDQLDDADDWGGDVRRSRRQFRRAAFEQNKPQTLALVAAALDKEFFAEAAAPLQEALEVSAHDADVQMLSERFQQKFRDWVAHYQSSPQGRRVESAVDPEQSYQLYIPPTADLSAPLPALYGFSPVADGAAVVAQFKDAADRHGFVILASNNSQNGPWNVIERAQEVMMEDSARRLRFDHRRSFASGFSGGARASILLATDYPDRVSGVLAKGAGGPNFEHPVEQPFPILFMVGREDPNRGNDIPMAARTYRRYGCPVEVWTYPGGHVFPPPDRLQDGVDFLFNMMRQRR